MIQVICSRLVTSVPDAFMKFFLIFQRIFNILKHLQLKCFKLIEAVVMPYYLEYVDPIYCKHLKIHMDKVLVAFVSFAEDGRTLFRFFHLGAPRLLRRVGYLTDTLVISPAYLCYMRLVQLILAFAGPSSVRAFNWALISLAIIIFVNLSPKLISLCANLMFSIVRKVFALTYYFFFQLPFSFFLSPFRFLKNSKSHAKVKKVKKE